MSDRKPTEEQCHILDLVRTIDDHIQIRSYAGTGKTSTAEMIAEICPQMLYIVFNKRNQLEAVERLPTTTDCVTWNGFGHGIWGKVVGVRLAVDSKKNADILRTFIREMTDRDQSDAWNIWTIVLDCLAKAKALGYVPKGVLEDTAKPLIGAEAFFAHPSLEEPPDEFGRGIVDEVLTRSIKAAYAGSIDFDDQIYMPAVFGGAFPHYPFVTLDEQQDQNSVNYAMLRRLIRGDSRLFGVGDQCQNIYGFRGALPNGMDEAVKEYSMRECELTVSFRCPSEVVKAARWRVPNFKWFRQGGHVETLKDLDPRAIPDHSAIICRNNAPLFRTGLKLLAEGRSITIAGSDIGPKVLGIMRKLGNDDTKRDVLMGRIEDWRSERLDRGSRTANDLADCMAVFAHRGRTLSQALAYAQSLFKQEGTLKLLTGHKSKGLEYDKVFLLDTFLLRDDEQDQNLRYVMQTRSSDQLFEIDSDRIKWSEPE